MFGTHGDSLRALQAAGFCSGKRTETPLQTKRGGGMGFYCPVGMYDQLTTTRVSGEGVTKVLA